MPLLTSDYDLLQMAQHLVLMILIARSTRKIWDEKVSYALYWV